MNQEILISLSAGLQNYPYPWNFREDFGHLKKKSFFKKSLNLRRFRLTTILLWVIPIWRCFTHLQLSFHRMLTKLKVISKHQS
jgi:hypothetical protein